jgi:crotonobetainyl-CoA:carnitine CoA-transferase CaiB-like acyl-CoA transferase
MPDAYTEPALTNIRVAIVDAGIAGGYLGRLLADAGAEVAHIEPREGTILQRRSARPDSPAGALYSHLSAGTMRLRIEPSDAADLARAVDALAAADVVVFDAIGADSRPTLTAAQLGSRCNGKIIVHLTLWGRGHAGSDRAGTEFTLQAAVGGTGGRGRPDSPPLSAGGDRGLWHTGAYAAIAVLAALGSAPATQPVELDVSAFECMVTGWNPYEWIRKVLYDPPRQMPRWTDVPSVERAKDGWVGITIITPDQWRAYCDMTEATDLLNDPTLSLLVPRSAEHERIRSATQPWLSRHTVAEVVAAAAKRRIPAVPVGPAGTLPELEHFQVRHTFIQAQDGLPQRPAAPYLLDGTRPCADFPVREVSGDHMRVWAERSPDAIADPLPLQELGILDVTAYWAGPIGTQVLAHLGADVVHVESAQRYDGIRNVTTRPRTEPGWWEYSFVYQGAQAGKRSLVLDLGDHRAVAALHRLLPRYDVIVENFSRDVAPKLGLAYEDLAARREGLIMVRMPGFGLSGPWSHYRAYAMTGDQLSGLAWRTGWPDDRPTCPRTIGDSFTGLHAAFAILVALHRRARTGGGALVEISSMEVAISLAAEEVVESTMNGLELGRPGNRSDRCAPQGVYRAAGEDDWVALCVDSDQMWRSLLQVAELEQQVPDATSWDLGERIGQHDKIDRALSNWFAAHSASEATKLLQQAGIAAEIVIATSELEENQLLHDRDFFRRLTHPLAGPLAYAALPWTINGRRPAPTSAAPLFDEHTDLVLHQAGLSDHDTAELRALKVIGGHPPIAPLEFTG